MRGSFTLLYSNIIKQLYKKLFLTKSTIDSIIRKMKKKSLGKNASMKIKISFQSSKEMIKTCLSLKCEGQSYKSTYMSFRWDSLFLPILKQGVIGLSISSYTGPSFRI